MAGLRQWLAEIGLEKHAETFEAAALDLDVLAELDDSHLKELGIPLGDRLRILKAAKQTPSERRDVEQGAAGQPPTAERRQLTVMFCDLVGSTALSEKLDPEDLRELMAAYRDAVGGVVKTYDGHIAQYLGDGVMVYFGWPHAHEDDAERAVRTALDVADVVKSVAAPKPLQVRIGVATGPVVVGEGPDDSNANKLAVGETPNLAARLQGLAGPDQIVIGPGTHRLVGGVFDYDDLGARNLKGIVEPVPAWRVKGASAAQGRFEAQAAGGLTPFVGRDAEVGLLMQRWRQACDGEGQVVVLSGEPGIGKSRLLQVLRERVADQPHTRLRYQCSPYYTNSAFYPVIDQIERAAGFDRGDSPDQKLDKLEAVFETVGDDQTETALVAAMLSLPIDRYPPLNLSPQRQKDDTCAALADQVRRLAMRQPLLMLFEDAHWCDPTTLDTIGQVIERIQDAPVLLVITARPEFEPPWTGHGHVAVQSLTRLSRREGTNLVHEATGGKELPAEIMDQIVAKTDGVPLFVEELTKTVLESGIVTDTGEGYELNGPLPPLAIPTTLQDSLMARLDRLSPVKEVAQIGACIGREFSYDMIASVSPLRDNELDDALQQLVNSELIFRRGAPPDATYTFKHALVQDAAYEGLLKSRRQLIHQTIADRLSASDQGIADTQPELLAHHMSAAGMIEQAVPLWLAAGKRATEHMALIEGSRHLNRGLDLLSDLPASQARDDREIEVRMALGTVSQMLNGWPAIEVETALAPARRLCAASDRLQDLFRILGILQANAMGRGLVRERNELTEQLLDIAERLNDPGHTAAAHSMASFCYFHSADFEIAGKHRDRALELYDFERDKHIVQYHNHDPFCGALIAAGSEMLWILGYPDQAVAAAEHHIAHARRLNHPFNLAYSLTQGAAAFQFRREPERLLRCIDEGATVAGEQNIGLITDLLVPGWGAPGFAQKGEYQEAIDQTDRAFDLWHRMGGLQNNSYAYGNQADWYRALGDAEKAQEMIARALNAVDDMDERYFEAEIHRIKGEILLAGATPDSEAAEASFRDAIRIAQSQRAKSWELRAATSLARLWQSQGKNAEARDLLTPVYDWFTEGFDTADLKDAKALLDELA